MREHDVADYYRNAEEHFDSVLACIHQVLDEYTGKYTDFAVEIRNCLIDHKLDDLISMLASVMPLQQDVDYFTKETLRINNRHYMASRMTAVMMVVGRNRNEAQQRLYELICKGKDLFSEIYTLDCQLTNERLTEQLKALSLGNNNH